MFCVIVVPALRDVLSSVACPKKFPKTLKFSGLQNSIERVGIIIVPSSIGLGKALRALLGTRTIAPIWSWPSMCIVTKSDALGEAPGPISLSGTIL